MYMSCSTKAFKWHSKPKNFKMIACSEFYCRQIAAKFFLKFPLCITNLVRLIQTVCCRYWSHVSECLFNRNSTNKETDRFHRNCPYGKILTKKGSISTLGFTSRLPCHITTRYISYSIIIAPILITSRPSRHHHVN